MGLEACSQDFIAFFLENGNDAGQIMDGNIQGIDGTFGSLQAFIMVDIS